MKKFFLARRFSWPITFSLFLHLSLIGGLVFASIKDQVEIPVAEEAVPINVIMVNPAMFATPEITADKESQATETKSEPEVTEPEPIPEPEPVVIPKSEPIPEPKPAEKPIEKPKPEKKPEPTKPKKQPKKEPKKEPVEKADIDKPATSPLVSNNINPVTTAPASSSMGAAPSSAGSKVLKQVEPAYPKQAFDRRVEGEVKVMFDISEDGWIENVRIISSNPPRMFEREVKLALKKWRYTSVVVKDKTLTIIFKIDSGATVQ